MRYIPTTYTPAYEMPGFAIYHGAGRGPTSLRYIGKQSKASGHYVYRTPEERAAADQRFIAQLQARDEEKKKRHAESQRPHTLKVGDVLSSSWGYEQTNVDFYQVVAVSSGRTVKIQRIASESLEGTGWASDMVVAVPGAFAGEEVLTKRASADNSIKISSYSWAFVWDGTPRHRSWYA